LLLLVVALRLSVGGAGNKAGNPIARLPPIPVCAIPRVGYTALPPGSG